jgi:hypothetical protein
VRQVQARLLEAGQRQGGEGQFLDLGVGFEAGVAVDLGADLELFAGRVQAGRAGVQSRRPLIESTSLKVLESVSCPAPASSDSTYSSIGGMTSSYP